MKSCFKPNDVIENLLKREVRNIAGMARSRSSTHSSFISRGLFCLNACWHSQLRLLSAILGLKSSALSSAVTFLNTP